MIVGYHSAGGRTTRDTAAHFGISSSTVSKLMAKYRQYGLLKDRPKSGRPKVTIPAQDNEIRVNVMRNRNITGKLHLK